MRSIVPALIFGLLSIPSLQAPAHAGGDCSLRFPTEDMPDQEEQNLLNEINRYRADPYEWSPTLGRAAIWMAHDMADNNYLGSTDSLDRDARMRLADCGYNLATPSGENEAAGIAYQYGDMLVLSEWFFEQQELQLIVSADYTVAGIGRAYNAFSTHKWYWVLVVGVDASTPAPSTLTPTSTNVPSTPTPLPPPPATSTWTPTTVPPTSTPTPTGVPPTATLTPTNTRTPTNTPTNTPTPTASRTPTSTPTFTPSSTPASTATAQPTATKKPRGGGNGNGNGSGNGRNK
jgi:uncharacterized protein YkwD